MGTGLHNVRGLRQRYRWSVPVQLWRKPLHSFGDKDRSRGRRPSGFSKTHHHRNHHRDQEGPKTPTCSPHVYFNTSIDERFADNVLIPYQSLLTTRDSAAGATCTQAKRTLYDKSGQ